MRVWRWLWVVLLLPAMAQAACRLPTPLVGNTTSDANVAKIRFGRVNLTDTYLQPVGTLLASTIVPATNSPIKGGNPDTVLWVCDLADMTPEKVYFMASTNADDRVGGHYETGLADGLPGVYATWYKYVGIKLTMENTVLSRLWQIIPVRTFATVGNKAHIRLKDIPVLHAQLFRISQIPPAGGSPTNVCPGFSAITVNGVAYTCGQPSAYIQLVGPPGSVAHDNAGEDHNTHWTFWGAHNGLGYGMWQSGTSLSNSATCRVVTDTTTVQFPTVSVQQLMNGETFAQNFQVRVECNNTVQSGTANNQVALGLQVSPGAYSAAQSLGLINGAGGIAYLLDDAYLSNPASAKGVGVVLRHATTDEDWLWVGQGNLTGANAGWHPVRGGAQAAGSAASGYTYWDHTLTGIFKRVPGQQVTAGTFDATATILVKMQ